MTSRRPIGTSTGWRLFGAGDGKPATVWPVNDLKPHEPDNPACWCRPRWDNEVLVHNAMEGNRLE